MLSVMFIFNFLQVVQGLAAAEASTSLVDAMFIQLVYKS